MSIDPSEGYEQSIKHVLANNLPAVESDVDMIAFCDASINPDGVAGVGWVICDPEGTIICKGTRSLTVASTRDTQKAETEAIIGAVEQIESMDWDNQTVKIYCDNKSVVEAFSQPTKLWKNDEFKALQERVNSEFVEWVKREYNRVADAISKNARKQASC